MPKEKTSSRKTSIKNLGLINLSELDNARRVEENIEDAPKLSLEQLSSILSHDLKSTINLAFLISTMLEKSAKDKLTSKEVSYLDFIRNAMNECSEYITDLQSSFNPKPPTLTKKKESLADILDEIILSLESEVRVRGAIISHEVDSTSLFVDRSRIKKALEIMIKNGLSNARQGVQPILRIHATENESTTHISICDNGTGVGEQEGLTMFKPYTDTASIKTFLGTGMNMNISNLFIKWHGGRLSFKNNPETGATFYIALPQS